MLLKFFLVLYCAFKVNGKGETTVGGMSTSQCWIDTMKCYSRTTFPQITVINSKMQNALDILCSIYVPYQTLQFFSLWNAAIDQLIAIWVQNTAQKTKFVTNNASTT